jgi:hypothetical protein
MTNDSVVVAADHEDRGKRARYSSDRPSQDTLAFSVRTGVRPIEK